MKGHVKSKAEKISRAIDEIGNIMERLIERQEYHFHCSECGDLVDSERYNRGRCGYCAFNGAVAEAYEEQKERT